MMKHESVHEPEAKVMNAAAVWNDARQIATELRQNLSKVEPAVQLQIPLGLILSALDNLSSDELAILHRHIEKRLAAIDTTRDNQ